MKEHGDCVYCGMSEREHHAYAPRYPYACMCERESWPRGADQPPVCAEFTPQVREPRRCKTCEHHEDCH